VSTHATQAKVQAVRSEVSASFAGPLPRSGAGDLGGVRLASAWKCPGDWALGPTNLPLADSIEARYMAVKRILQKMQRNC